LTFCRANPTRAVNVAPGGHGQLEESTRMGSKATVAAAGSSMTWMSVNRRGSVDNLLSTMIQGLF
jgi:hypothetical protein